MTRVFLAAGVASLAIAAPVVAGPHGNHGDRGGGGGGQQAFVNRGGGGGGRGGDAFSAPRAQHQSAPHFEQRQQRMSMPQEQHAQRFAMERPQHSQRVEMRQQRAEHPQSRVAARQEMRQSHAQQRVASRNEMRANRSPAQNCQQVLAPVVSSRRIIVNRLRLNRAQAQNRQQIRENRVQQAQNRQQMNGQNRMAMRQQMQWSGAGPNGAASADSSRTPAWRTEPSGRTSRASLRPDRQCRRVPNEPASPRRSKLRARGSSLLRTRSASSVEPVGIGSNNFVTLSALPQSVSYLYPATPNYYYQYGGGYLYQVDRSSSLINALIPLLAGGFLPGTYLPQPYMSSYVPSYYGLNSFYPAVRYGAGYGYGYGVPNLCNRYAYGVVYQVDCVHRHGRERDPDLRGRLRRRADAAFGIQLLQRADAVSQHVLSDGRLLLLVCAGRDLPVRSGAEPHHVGRGADVAGLHDRPAVAGGLWHVQRADGLSQRPTTTRRTPGTVTTTATSTRSTRRRARDGDRRVAPDLGRRTSLMIR